MKNNMGLQNLLKEPQRLAFESEKINLELDSLVLDNYRIFIENLTCSAHLQAEDKNLTDVCAELDSNIRILAHQCLTFKDRIGGVVASHKRNRKTLQHHIQLIELLEVPQLVEACVRNSFYDEALELANFVNGLERRHLLASEVKSLDGKLRGGCGVVQSIVSDVNKTLVELRRFLLHHFAQETPLPVEIQTLSTLRKLDRMLIDRHLSLVRHRCELVPTDVALAYSAREEHRLRLVKRSNVRLQMDILEARTVLLQKRLLGNAVRPELKSVPASDSNLGTASTSQLGPYGRVIEMLEMRRTSWFATVTQFATLFQLNISEAAVLTTSQSSNDGDGDAEFCGFAVLNAWIVRQVENLLTEMAEILPLISEGGSLRSILEQTLFFAHRMGQVGCEFTDLVMPLFENIVLDRVKSELRVAGENFSYIMQHERIVFDQEGNLFDVDGPAKSDATGRKEQLIPLFLDQNFSDLQQEALLIADNDASNASRLQQHDYFSVPTSLMRFPPLAYVVNCFSKTLNFLRECPMVSVHAEVRQLFFALIKEISEYLCTNSANIKASGGLHTSNGNTQQQVAEASGQRSLDMLYAEAVAYDLFPHILLCLEAVFGTSHSKLLDRVRNYKLKHSLVVSRSAAEIRSDGTCLVSTVAQAQELLGKGTARDLLVNCWGLLNNAKLLSYDTDQQPLHANK